MRRLVLGTDDRSKTTCVCDWRCREEGRRAVEEIRMICGRETRHVVFEKLLASCYETIAVQTSSLAEVDELG